MRSLPIQESSCPIDWQPSALAPVFYGYREYTVADGAPMTVRVYYPSLDGAPDGAPPLLGCGRYPLIMFCHGSCPGESLQYQKWFELPAQLARAGYVVAVPQIIGIGGLPHQSPDVQALLRDMLDWMRTGWEHLDTLLPPPATGLAGHSYGALHAGILATTRPVLAVASLSGVWEDYTSSPIPIHQGAPARLFTWGTHTSSDASADLPPQFWNPIPQPKYRVLFADAEHFDYLYTAELPCRRLRGPCPFVGAYTTDTVTMFFARYLQPEHWPDLSTKIPDSLIPPTTAELAQNLTPEQQFFLGGYLAGVPAFHDMSKCKIALRESPPDLVEGQLLFYRDNTREGVGDLHSPSVIGQGGWQYLTKVFSGGDGIIYAVNTQGELLFYRDHNRDGTGDVHTPSVIGLGGWQHMQHLTYGGDGIIYAVDDQGRLLFYRDHNRDGSGDVNTPSVIGLGGWQHMLRLVAGEQGVLYAVDDLGQLLYYRDYHRDGSGDVNTPKVIGNGGWQAFSQLTYGGDKILYAVVGA